MDILSETQRTSSLASDCYSGWSSNWSFNAIGKYEEFTTLEQQIEKLDHLRMFGKYKEADELKDKLNAERLKRLREVTLEEKARSPEPEQESELKLGELRLFVLDGVHEDLYECIQELIKNLNMIEPNEIKSMFESTFLKSLEIVLYIVKNYKGREKDRAIKSINSFNNTVLELVRIRNETEDIEMITKIKTLEGIQ